MYTQSWNKYLPVIRILFKRSATGEQTLNLNAPDFEKIVPVRKTGYKFTLYFKNGKVNTDTKMSELAKDLSSVLLHDEVINDLSNKNEYQVSLNSKLQLSIQLTKKLSQQQETPNV